MKKPLAVLILILTCTFFIPASFAEVTCSRNNGYISVSANGQKEVDPNVAQITFTIETTNKTVPLASDENKIIVNQVVSALKSCLDFKSGDEIKTSNFSVNPIYTYTKDNKRNLEGYTVVNSINIKTKKISSVGNLIDIAVKKGANRLDSLSFSLENERNVCDDLYPQVVKDAQNQASIIAKALNLNIIGLKSLNAACGVEYSGRMPYNAMFAKSMGESSSSFNTPIEPGKIKVNATVNADFNVQ